MARLVRRVLPLVLTCLLIVAAPARAAVPGTGGWDPQSQHAAAQAGLMHVLDDGAFHGERPLTGAQLRESLGTLGDQLGTQSTPAPDTATVSVAGFDRLLVAQLGLGDVAAAVQHEAWRAGLTPPARFGSEVVARFLGLRFNHPSGAERLELYPTDAITRAEAAYSLARVAGTGGSELEAARASLLAFALPDYNARQRAALRVAVSKIGMPYVWGGETDGPSWGQVHGGYDCSGFVWRVFRSTGLVGSIRGRTAAQMAGEIRRSARITFDDVRAGDVLFFGPGRFGQKATERRIVHTGIALGNGWMIDSSSQGVFVESLSGWRRGEFSWARRVL